MNVKSRIGPSPQQLRQVEADVNGYLINVICGLIATCYVSRPLGIYLLNNSR